MSDIKKITIHQSFSKYSDYKWEICVRYKDGGYMYINAKDDNRLMEILEEKIKEIDE